MTNAADRPDPEGNLPPEQTGAFSARLKQFFLRQEKDDALTQALQNGEGIAAGLSQDRRDMIERVIAFDEKQVVDVMLPRADIIGVENTITLPELLSAFSEAGHSRMPVYRGDLDDPIGMVHIKDVVGLLAEPEHHEADATHPAPPILEKIVRKLIYVPPSMPVTDLLLRMQADRVHMALVIDEYGGTDGLVTIEDLVEEIVGEIHDEHDDGSAPQLVQMAEGVWEASARVELEDLKSLTTFQFDGDEDEIDTLGGLVFNLAGRVPGRGELIRSDQGFEFEVLDADARRVRKLKVRAPAQAKAKAHARARAKAKADELNQAPLSNKE